MPHSHKRREARAEAVRHACDIASGLDHLELLGWMFHYEYNIDIVTIVNTVAAICQACATHGSNKTYKAMDETNRTQRLDIITQPSKNVLDTAKILSTALNMKILCADDTFSNYFSTKVCYLWHPLDDAALPPQDPEQVWERLEDLCIWIDNRVDHAKVYYDEQCLFRALRAFNASAATQWPYAEGLAALCLELSIPGLFGATSGAYGTIPAASPPCSPLTASRLLELEAAGQLGLRDHIRQTVCHLASGGSRHSRSAEIA